MMNKTKKYSLNKSHQILKSGYKWYKKRKNSLPPTELQQFEIQLEALDHAVLKGDQDEASRLAHQVEEFCDSHFKKSFWEYCLEMCIAIVIAIVVATIVRQTWFELYEIPTGSMRPTFEEQDHLTVTKTSFGLNVPLTNKHFYFDPNLIQRTGVVIWSGEGINHLDSESTFMGIFPYTKRFIKRCMGKPGDTLYFYGGKIYGFDRDGKDLVELRDNKWTAHLEHIPFNRFDGRESKKEDRAGEKIQLTYHHFNKAIGRLSISRQDFKGEVFNGKEWIKDNPEAQKSPHSTIQTYSDWWGIRNFAMGRLLNKSQLEAFTPYHANEMEDALLYLELRHTPSLNYPAPFVLQRGLAAIRGFSTVIPLQEKHLQALMDHMYTCRFIVNDGHASPYGFQNKNSYTLRDFKKGINAILRHELFRVNIEKINPTFPLFPKVPNGSYEFYYGRGLKVGWGAITSYLPSTDPLLSETPENIQKLYNVGIDMTTFVEPYESNQLYFPNRYVYFRNGNLYTMGGIFMTANDPLLISFHEREKKKEEASTRQNPYVAFKDYGPPITPEGQLDKEFISTFGFKVPEGEYLMLGDNHAMSQDSRYFGPIPQSNLEGAPSLILWPPGERWGCPNQKPYPLITLPRLIVWSIAGLIALIWFLIHRHNRKKPVFKKLP